MTAHARTRDHGQRRRHFQGVPAERLRDSHAPLSHTRLGFATTGPFASAQDQTLGPGSGSSAHTL